MTFQGANRVEGPDCHVSYDRKLQPSMILRFILLSLIPLAALIASGATEDCHYKFPKKINPRRVRLCSSQLPQWGNDPEVEASLPALHNSSLFCSTKSVVLNFFSLVNVSIDLTHSRSDVLRIERSCDLVISVTNGLTFYETFHIIKNTPLVLAYTRGRGPSTCIRGKGSIHLHYAHLKTISEVILRSSIFLAHLQTITVM